MKHPVARAKKLKRAQNAHRHNRPTKFLRNAENAFAKWPDMSVARTRTLRKSNQADSGIKRHFSATCHFLEASAAGYIRHRNISKSSHHPAIDWNLEMRFQFKAANELRNRRINHKGIEQVHMIANENGSFVRIEARRALHFELHSGNSQNIAEENALRPIVLARIKKNREKNQKSADHKKMQPAHHPQNGGAHGEPSPLHA